MSKFKLLTGLILIIALVALGIGQSKFQNAVAANNELMAPAFEVDPFWPKPLPNQWIMGPTIGIDIDERDHIFIVHRATEDLFGLGTEIGLFSGVSECCTPAPPVLEFDIEGNLIKAWGGHVEGAPYVWPASNHGIEVAPNGDIWIGGNGEGDTHMLVFTQDGEYLRTVGIPGVGQDGTDTEYLPDGSPNIAIDSNSTVHFSRVAEIEIDEEFNEVYVADGYRNRRVAVLDLDTGDFKRFWGAYGNQPDDTTDVTYTPGEAGPQQFRGPVHCAVPSNDGLVYVCDRGADRIQIFRKDGTYLREVIIAPETLNQGSTWDIDFSPDAEQKYLYLVDGQNFKVYILDRESMEILYTFGDGGRQPGLFFAPHSIATDSQGNLYTTETYEGKRVQKFVNQGMRPVTIRDRAPTWPTDEL